MKEPPPQLLVVGMAVVYALMRYFVPEANWAAYLFIGVAYAFSSFVLVLLNVQKPYWIVPLFVVCTFAAAQRIDFGISWIPKLDSVEAKFEEESISRLPDTTGTSR